MIGRQAVTPESIQNLATSAQSVATITRSDDLPGVIRSVARGSEEMGIVDPKTGQLSAKILSDNALAFQHMIGMTSGMVTADQLQHTLQMGQAGFRNADLAHDVHLQAQVAVASENLKGKTGQAFSTLGTDFRSGNFLNKPESRALLNDAGLLDVSKVNVALDPENAMKGGGGGKGGLQFINTPQMLRGYDPRTDPMGIQFLGKTYEREREILSAKGVKGDDLETQVQGIIEKIFPQNAARLGSALFSKTGLEQTKRNEEAAQNMANDFADLADRTMNLDLAMLSVTKSWETMTSVVGRTSGLTAEATHALTGLSRAMDGVAKFASTDVGGIVSTGLGKAGEALIAFIGVTALLRTAGLAARLLGWMPALEAGAAALGIAMAPATAAIAGVVSATILATEAFMKLDEFLKSHFSFFNDKGLDDIKKHGVVDKPGTTPEASKGWLEQALHTIFPMTKYFGLPELGSQGLPASSVSAMGHKQTEYAFQNTAAANTPLGPLPAVSASATGTPGTAGQPPSHAHPVSSYAPTKLTLPLPGGAHIPGLAPPTTAHGSPIPATPAGRLPIAGPSLGATTSIPTLPGGSSAAFPNMHDVGAIHADTLNVGNVNGLGGKATPGTPGGSVSSGVGAGPGATGIGGPGGVTPSAGTARLPNGPGPSSRMPIGVHGSAPSAPLAPYQAGSLLKNLGVNQSEYDAYRKSVAGIESKGNYGIMGGSSGKYAGAYQMGPTEIKETAAKLGVPAPTQAEFLGNPAMQEKFFEAYTSGHNDYLMAHNQKYANATPEQKLEYLSYAHNQGAGGADKWLNTGIVGHDAFNTPGTAYPAAVQRELALPNIQGPKPDPTQTEMASSSLNINVHSHHYMDSDEIASITASHFISGGSASSATMYDSKQMPLTPGISMPGR